MTVKHLAIIILFIVNLTGTAIAQGNDCKVLKPEIAQKYSGDCKKGLADGKGTAEGTDQYEGRFKNGLPHGKGTYHYANGDVYTGDFKNGVRNGNGKFTFKIHERDSTFTGIWKNDELVEKIIPPAYSINQTMNISRYTIQKVGHGNRVLFAFFQNGSPNASVGNLLIAGNAGTSLSIGKQIGYDNVLFPYSCKVSYVSANSFRTAVYNCIFDVQINEPGQWLISLYN